MTVKRFITAFIICALILVAVLAMIRADLYSRQLSGDYNRTIFSYEKTSYNKARLELFGVVYSIDLILVDEVKEKVIEIYSHSVNYIPDFILNTGSIFKDAIINLINSLQTNINMV